MHYFKVHTENPQKRVINQLVEHLKAGKLIVYPTDSAYALGCLLNNRAAIERIRQIRALKENHPMTLMCADIAQAAQYALIDDRAYKLMKEFTPGAYTFVLKATKNIAKVAQGSKRKEVGIRIPEHAIALKIVEELGEPLLSATLWLPQDPSPVYEIDTSEPIVGVDVIVDAGPCTSFATTIVDLVGQTPSVVRRRDEYDDIENYF